MSETVSIPATPKKVTKKAAAKAIAPTLTKEEFIRGRINTILDDVRYAKPQQRCDEARHYAVVATDLEKVLAYFTYYIADPAEANRKLGLETVTMPAKEEDNVATK